MSCPNSYAPPKLHKMRQSHDIYRHGLTYIVIAGYISWQFYNEHKKCQMYECCTDIYLVLQIYVRTKFIKHNIFCKMTCYMSVWLLIYPTTTIYIVTTTIYIVFFDFCAFSDIYRGFFRQIEFIVAHIRGLPTYITENGCSHVRHGTIYEQSFSMKKRKWQRICVSTHP